MIELTAAATYITAAAAPAVEEAGRAGGGSPEAADASWDAIAEQSPSTSTHVDEQRQVGS
eukprot:COSAG06_NODE_13611_length_1239_cov_2.642982_2_plen_59_part_01